MRLFCFWASFLAHVLCARRGDTQNAILFVAIIFGHVGDQFRCDVTRSSCLSAMLSSFLCRRSRNILLWNIHFFTFEYFFLATISRIENDHLLVPLTGPFAMKTTGVFAQRCVRKKNFKRCCDVEIKKLTNAVKELQHAKNKVTMAVAVSHKQIAILEEMLRAASIREKKLEHLVELCELRFFLWHQSMDF